jgi:hypothetical protein
VLFRALVKAGHERPTLQAAAQLSLFLIFAFMHGALLAIGLISFIGFGGAWRLLARLFLLLP